MISMEPSVSMLGHFMANQVQAQPVHPPQPANPAAPVAPQVPAGVGNAPTTLTPPPASEKSWIETGVIYIWEKMVSLFKSVFFCFFKGPSPAAAPLPPLPPLVQNPHQMLLRRVKDTLSNAEILTHFDTYVPEPERNNIYFSYGRRIAQPGWFSKPPTREQILAAGRDFIETDPSVIFPVLARKIEEAANR